MTKLEAMRALLSKPRDHADQGRIGRRVRWAKSDGRERIDYCVRVLRAVLKRVA